MAEIFSALPCDARIQQVCDLITRSIEHGHQFRRTVLQRKCEPPFVATPPPVRQSSATRKVPHARARVLQKALSRPRCFACCDSASQGALRSVASGTLRLPVKDPPPPQPLSDHPSLEVLRLRGRSGRGQSRARPTLLRIHSATAVSMSRREARSLHSSPNPCSKHGERRHDSTGPSKPPGDKWRRWNPVPQATLNRARARAKAAEERRALQTFAEGPPRETRRPLREMLSWDPNKRCYLPPQATLMRALARQRRDSGLKSEGVPLRGCSPRSPLLSPSRLDPVATHASIASAKGTASAKLSVSARSAVQRRRVAAREGAGYACAGDSAMPSPPSDVRSPTTTTLSAPYSGGLSGEASGFLSSSYVSAATSGKLQSVGSVTAAEARTSLTGGAFIGKPRVINMRIGSARPAASEHASMQQRRPPRPAQDRYAAQSTPRLRGP